MKERQTAIRWRGGLTLLVLVLSGGVGCGLNGCSKEKVDLEGGGEALNYPEARKNDRTAGGGGATSFLDDTKIGRDQGGGPWFLEKAAAVGLDFVHFNGMSGESYFNENMGAGAALFDYDKDGDLDVYLVQGNILGEKKSYADARIPPKGELPPRDRLFRNDLRVETDGTTLLKFTDVTRESGIMATGYGMGVAVGDIDNDGWLDLYVTNDGPNQLFRNNGDGTFRDVTAEAGVDDPRWSASAVFFDMDRDGDLDLYVANYVRYRPDERQVCRTSWGARSYCSPNNYQAVGDALFRNLGAGRFEDVSAASRVGGARGKGLGVLTVDANDDGWPDLYVANDNTPNFLWINQRDGSFRERALETGCAFNADGEAESSMGVDAGDFDGDGDEDLFMTHWARETNTLYVNNGAGFFEDRTALSGLAAGSLTRTGFGVAWFDYDNDSLLDLLVANGAVGVIRELVEKGDPYPLHEVNQLYRNLGNGRFKDVSRRAGPAFRLSDVSRGAAFGDVDNDGDVDVLIANNAGPVRLLLNQLGNRNLWIGFRLLEGRPGRVPIGARLGVFRKGAPPLWRRVRVGGSYCSSRDPRVVVGLGKGGAVEKVRVRWPDLTWEEWVGLGSGAYHILLKGSGKRCCRGEK